MSEHLPECTLPKGWGDCICAELSACEQRVRTEKMAHDEQPGIVNRSKGNNTAEHDEFCPYSHPFEDGQGGWYVGGPCDCDLIARVREDERGKARERVLGLAMVQGMVPRFTAADAAGGGS